MPQAQWLEADWSRRLVQFLQKHPEAGEVYEAHERVAWDGTRVDVLTEKIAFEIDRARKWAEAVGQSVLYGLRHNRDRGIVLLSEDFVADRNLIGNCELVCRELGIHLWLIDVAREEIYIYGDRYSLVEGEVEAQQQRRIKGL